MPFSARPATTSLVPACGWAAMKPRTASDLLTGVPFSDAAGLAMECDRLVFGAGGLRPLRYGTLARPAPIRGSVRRVLADSAQGIAREGPGHDVKSPGSA